MLDIGDQIFAQDTKNWQVSHSWAIKSNLVNQFRVGRVEARADQAGIPCPQADVDFLRLTGVFTNLPDNQRECPSIGIQGYAGTGGAVNAYSASNQPMWDIGNSTTYVLGSHNLNFGFNYRRWQLQRDLATGFLGNYGFNVGFTGNRGRRHAARVLHERRAVPARRIQRPRAARQSARVQLPVFRAVLAGRLESQLPADGEPGSALGLPQYAV